MAPGTHRVLAGCCSSGPCFLSTWAACIDGFQWTALALGIVGDAPAGGAAIMASHPRRRFLPLRTPVTQSLTPPWRRIVGGHTATGDRFPPPRRMISRLVVISQREERLAGCALSLSVIADNPGSLSESILPAIAQRFEIEESLLSIHNLGPASFLLISPDDITATRILNDGRPLSIPPGRLYAMRWSCFFSSSAALFSSAVEVEIRGIPAHALDLETASQLLSDCCVPCVVHLDTAI